VDCFGSPFTFTGELTDANALLYLRARYYSPALGVFTALDPVEGNTQQAMSLNRYGYVVENPSNNTDPSGLAARLPLDSCGVPETYQTACPLLRGIMNQGLSEVEALFVMARLIAAAGYQQNRSVGYRAMVMSMVAMINLVDSGNTTITGFQGYQSIYSYSCAQDDSTLQALNACMGHLVPKDESKCEIAYSPESVLHLYGCVEGYFENQLDPARAEPYPENSTFLAQQALLAAFLLVLGRCSSRADTAMYFRRLNPELATAIAYIDSNDDMTFAYSFHGSWDNEVDLEARAEELREQGYDFKYFVEPPRSSGGVPTRAIMFTNIQDAPLCFWQCPKGETCNDNCVRNACSRTDQCSS
jgi:RHS repeat-associated protein